MDYLDYFLKTFGDITVAQVCFFILGVVFLFLVYRKLSDYLIKKHEANKQKDDQLAEALAAVRKYPEYRKQSLQIQDKLEKENQETRNYVEKQIGETMELQRDIIKRLDTIEENSKRRERNKLRDRLIQSYRYYTGQEKNPQAAWTKMESEAFHELLKDYNDMGGNDYIHTEVEPAMERLRVVEMEDKDGIRDLMHSRT